MLFRVSKLKFHKAKPPSNLVDLVHAKKYMYIRIKLFLPVVAYLLEFGYSHLLAAKSDQLN